MGRPKIAGEVERVNGKDLSYDDFVSRYLRLNRPVVLTGLMGGWRACEDWVTDDGLPNLTFVSNHFGNSIVQVADCCKREFTDQKRVEMSVSEFINHWLDNPAASQTNGSTRNDDAVRPLLYLKDWHFVKEYPDYVAYRTPEFFTDDWLNLYLDSYSMHGNPENALDQNEINCSDYRFVYMGGKGTWTPLHADVFRSYSWSANVCGKKIWYFLSPSQSHLLFDRYLKTSVYDIFGDVLEKKYPGFKDTVWLECTQEKNEIIFVPSGWYHQVYNLEDTISINHNWFNGYNLHWVWNLLVRDYNEAREYIEDIREISDDFEGLCQRNLAANTGMNFSDFFIFMIRFSLANLMQMLHHKEHKEEHLPCLSVSSQLLHNLLSICDVATNMKSAETFSIENMHRRSTKDAVLSDICKILVEPQFLELQMAVCRTYAKLEEFQDVNMNPGNASLCQTCCSILKQFIAGVRNSNLENAVEFNHFRPEDLIRLVGHVVADVKDLHDSFNSDWKSEFLNYETSFVL